jgi:hypothetical protein
MANITGWGRGTWGQLTWGEPLPVTLTAPSAATSAVGSLTVDAEANVTPASLVGTTGTPAAGVNAQAIVYLPSALATLGSVSVNVDGEANVSPTGVAAASAIGTPTLITNNNLSVTLNAAVANTGELVIIARAIVTLPDDIVAGLITNEPYLNVWSLIPPNQDTDWEPVNDSQTPNWREVA